jgi:hypothetical protein
MSARRAFCLALLIATLAGAACASPEAMRTRSGGPGADIGNHDAVPNIHGRTDPYYETPRYEQAAGR